MAGTRITIRLSEAQLDRLDDLAAECGGNWSLTPQRPLDDAEVRAFRCSGGRVVLERIEPCLPVLADPCDPAESGSSDCGRSVSRRTRLSSLTRCSAITPASRGTRRWRLTAGFAIGKARWISLFAVRPPAAR
jgi:hypothetical protein